MPENSEDPKLRREAYDAIENLTTERSSFDVEKLDTYDKLEIFCPQAALTPSQYNDPDMMQIVKSAAPHWYFRGVAQGKLSTK